MEHYQSASSVASKNKTALAYARVGKTNSKLKQPLTSDLPDFSNFNESPQHPSQGNNRPARQSNNNNPIYDAIMGQMSPDNGQYISKLVQANNKIKSQRASHKQPTDNNKSLHASTNTVYFKSITNNSNNFHQRTRSYADVLNDPNGNRYGMHKGNIHSISYKRLGDQSGDNRDEDEFDNVNNDDEEIETPTSGMNNNRSKLSVQNNKANRNYNQGEEDTRQFQEEQGSQHDPEDISEGNPYQEEDNPTDNIYDSIKHTLMNSKQIPKAVDRRAKFFQSTVKNKGHYYEDRQRSVQIKATAFQTPREEVKTSARLYDAKTGTKNNNNSMNLKQNYLNPNANFISYLDTYVEILSTAPPPRRQMQHHEMAEISELEKQNKKLQRKIENYDKKMKELQLSHHMELSRLKKNEQKLKASLQRIQDKCNGLVEQLEEQKEERQKLEYFFNDFHSKMKYIKGDSKKPSAHKSGAIYQSYDRLYANNNLNSHNSSEMMESLPDEEDQKVNGYYEDSSSESYTREMAYNMNRSKSKERKYPVKKEDPRKMIKFLKKDEDRRKLEPSSDVDSNN